MDPVHLLEEMLPIDSTSGAERELAEYLLPLLESAGYRVEKQSVAGGRVNLWATRGAPPAIFCTHLDTVPPHLPARREGDTLWGRGACDAKGQIAVMIATAETIHRDLGESPALLLVSGEESDHEGARCAAARGLPAAPIVLGEPTGGRLIRGGKGLLKLELEAGGRAAHSAYPELGDSAIDRLVRALSRLQRAALPGTKDLGPSTMNVGRIAGGIADNVVAPRARAELFLRCAAPTARVEAVVDAVCATEGVAVAERGRSEPIRFETLPGFETGVVPFGTDGPFLPAAAGRFLIGPGDIRLAHSPEERIGTAELTRGVAQLRELVTALKS